MEGLIPTKYYEKTKEELVSAGGTDLKIQYKLVNTCIINNNIKFKQTFLLIKNLTNNVILGTHFLTQLYPFSVDNYGVHTEVLGQKLLFPFILQPVEKEVDILKK